MDFLATAAVPAETATAATAAKYQQKRNYVSATVSAAATIVATAKAAAKAAATAAK